MTEVVAKNCLNQGRIRTLSNGGRSSVGRAPDCGSGGRGFEPHRPPHFFTGFRVGAGGGTRWAISSIGRAVDS